ncbi:site-specific integrase [Mariprofundus ferrooxydans]|uniref:site-specific integrase n=1 Tax=Mariprofundus ferrooxydans TaxID=314344 RepID=UPI00142FAE6E|nr:site-specific integrase [Mariprofundus ferrooxydans]
MAILKRVGKTCTTYRVQVYHKKKVVADATFDRRRDATAFETAVKAKLQATGGYVDRSLAERMTLADALDKYVAEVSPTLKGGRTDKSRANIIKKYPIARLPLSAVKADDIRLFRDQRGQDVGPNSVRLDMALISQTFTQARSEWQMDYLNNPVTGVKKISLKGTQRDRRLHPGEYDRLMAAALLHDNAMRFLIPFAIETAMRQSEIAGIVPAWVSLKNRTVALPETKNGSPRVVPLSSLAYSIIAPLVASCVPGEPVFRYAKAHSISKAFPPICAGTLSEDGKKAEPITGLTFHDLRHEATSRLFEKGLSTEQVMAITGHKTYAMLARYTHLRHDQAVMDLLG